MLKPICLAAVCLAALTAPALASAAPLPDAAPQAHGRHVTLLPRCPDVPLPWNVKQAYLERTVNGVIVCASEEGSRFAATMTFASSHQPDCRTVQTMTTQWLCERKVANIVS
jgi:hypothetical protein